MSLSYSYKQSSFCIEAANLFDLILIIHFLNYLVVSQYEYLENKKIEEEDSQDSSLPIVTFGRINDEASLVLSYIEVLSSCSFFSSVFSH